MNRSRTLLILRSLLFLVDAEQSRRDRKGGPYNEEAAGRLLADEIRAELDEADNEAAAVLAAREAEERPVFEGREKDEGGHTLIPTNLKNIDYS